MTPLTATLRVSVSNSVDAHGLRNLPRANPDQPRAYRAPTATNRSLVTQLAETPTSQESVNHVGRSAPTGTRPSSQRPLPADRLIVVGGRC